MVQKHQIAQFLLYRHHLWSVWLKEVHIFGIFDPSYGPKASINTVFAVFDINCAQYA